MNMNADNTAYASDRCECMFSMLTRYGFTLCTRFSPADEVIIHPPLDFRLDFVPSVAMLTGVPFWMIVARLSGYSVNKCLNNCCFHIGRWLQ